MIPYLIEITDMKWIICTGAVFAFAVTWLMLHFFKDKLPRDLGREFAHDGKKSAGKPRGAGIIFILTFVLSVLLFCDLNREVFVYLILLVLAMVTGYLDDNSRNPWGEYKKGFLDLMIALVVAVTYLYYNSNELTFALNGATINLPPIVYGGLIVILVWASINVTNCTDGVDGLSATLSIITLGSILIYILEKGIHVEFGLIILIFIMVLMAYLWFNSTPSILMMGDAGSRAMGLFLAMAVLKTGSPLLFIPFALIIILDGGLGLLKVFLLRFLKIKILTKTRTPLHDHTRKNMGWSNSQTVFRFSILQVLISMILLIFLLLLAGCGTEDSSEISQNQDVVANQNIDSNSVIEDEEDTESIKEDTESVIEEDVTPSTTSLIELPDLKITSKEITPSAAMNFVADMKVGINLGNSLDACLEENTLDNELDYESCWGNIATTKDMIDEIKAAGFQTIRIPVSWHNHVDDNFIISEAWMNRVKEVVDYAYTNDMYVIVNIHHDTMLGFYYPDTEHYDTSEKYIISIWKQIADEFQDYDEKLIFESINEPRLVGTSYEWWFDSGNATALDAVACINDLNQVFVDTVRATGGNNPTRYLMVPGYGASANFALLDAFVFPTDIATNDNKIILSVHAYTPYNFTLQAQTEAGAVSDFRVDNSIRTSEISSFMTQLYDTFIAKGIPVVIGEFGARDKEGNLQDRVDFTAFYTATARSMGITCIWWDNNSFEGGGENFGLFKRDTKTWPYPDILKALIQYSDNK